ncbi:MAG: DUF885 domain-containing protein [Hyphomonadaceae bacterium]
MRIGVWVRNGVAAAGLAAAVLAGCTKTDEAAKGADADWPSFVNAWIESDLKANPTFAFYEGREEYAGQFPDWSADGLKAESDRLNDWKARAEAMDVSGLTDAQKFERDYLLALIDGRLFWQVTADQPHLSPTWYWLDPGVYLDRPYADLATRMADYTKWASNVPAAAAQIKANLTGPLPSVQIDMGASSFGPMAGFLRSEVPGVFKDVDDAAAQAAFAAANEAAAAALDDLDAHMESLRATQVNEFALGPDLFSKMLYATERVSTPLDELKAIGEADLQRNLDALSEACALYAPGQSVKQCIAKEAANKPDGGDPVAYARKQLVELRQFVIDHDVVSVPGTEEAMVKQAPSYNAQNSAYIDPSPPFEKDMPAFYNIAAPDPSWPKEKQDAYIPAKADLLFTSVHEVWPGHFLQFLHSNRSESMFGKLYVGYAFAEGWAHYAEEMMWEEGLGEGDPETHIGQLTNALLRNVRFLSAIGMHTGGMTIEESKQMFIDKGMQDEGNAEQQAARGAYDPAYLNYTMGKLMIMKLRADWCEAKGMAPASDDYKACWKDFHDAFLSHGGPPIPLVRGAMMNEPPASVF